MVLLVVFSLMMLFLVTGGLVSFAAARHFTRTYVIPAPANEKLTPRLDPSARKVRANYDARRDALLEAEKRRREEEGLN